MEKGCAFSVIENQSDKLSKPALWLCWSDNVDYAGCGHCALVHYCAVLQNIYLLEKTNEHYETYWMLSTAKYR